MQNRTAQTLLSAVFEGLRVSIGAEDSDELKRLSDRKALTCPVCNSIVTLHAGRVRAHHFAHLPGANCFIPHSEPESEEHRTGKLELANWLRKKIPDGKVTLEAWFPETKQRADVYLETSEPGKERVALEFQCANLSSREWHRRHSLYRQSGILDLWFLGGSRFHSEAMTSNSGAAKQFFLRTTELERTLILAKEIGRAHV